MWHPRPDAEDESVRDLRRAMIPKQDRPLTPRALRDRSELLDPDLGRLSDVAQPGGFRRHHIKQIPTEQKVNVDYAKSSLVQTTLIKMMDQSVIHDSLMQMLEPSIGLSYLENTEEFEETAAGAGGEDPHTGAARGGSSNLATAIMICKCCFGAAVLIIPRGFRNAGIVFGPALLIVVYVFMITVMLRLLQARQTRSDHPHYHDMGDVLGSWGKSAVKMSLIVAVFGFNCVWCVTCQENVRMLLPTWGSTARLWVSFPFVAPLCWVRKLKVFTVTNLLGVVLCVSTWFYLFYFSASKIAVQGPAEAIRAVNTVHEDWLLWLGTCSYIFELAYLALPIYEAAADKKAVPKLLVGVTATILTMYIAFGCCFYLAFGEDTEVLALLNLPRDSDAGVIFPVCFAIIGFVTMPINFFLLFQSYELQAPWPKTYRCRKWAKNLVRAAIVALLYCVTWAGGEQLQNFLGLVGGFFGTTLALTLPTIIHTATCKPRGLSLAWDILSFIVGLCITSLSTFQAVRSWK